MIIDIGAGNKNVNFHKGGGAAVKVEDNKQVTYTANGTFEIAPSDGYDAIKGAEVKVEVTKPIEKFVVPDGMKFSNSKNVDFTSFDFVNVTDWVNMFERNDGSSVNLDGYEITGSMKQMLYSFKGNLTLGNFSANHITSLYCTFYDCDFGGQDLDLTKIDTSECDDFTTLLLYAKNIRNINARGLDFSKVIEEKKKTKVDFSRMALGEIDLSVPIGKINSWGNYAYPSLFSTKADKINVDNWNVTIDITDGFGQFACDEINISSWTVKSSVFYPFSDCLVKKVIADNLNLETVEYISSTSSVVYDTAAFSGMDNCLSVSAKNWNLSNCKKMTGAFYQNNASVIDVSGWVTSACMDMRSMFQTCKNITTLDLSSFETSKVTTMRDMFYYDISLSSLDLSNFDCSSLTNMYNMFYNCVKLSKLVLSSKFFSSSTLTTYDFSGATAWTEETSLATLVDALPQLTTSKAIKLSTATKNALTDEQKTTITDKGWTIA